MLQERSFFMSKSTQKLAETAVFIALFIVLSYMSLDFGNISITFKGLPVIIGALFMGPVAGMEIGLFGSLVDQVLRYGFTATTLLWVLPYVVLGLVSGAMGKKMGNPLTRKRLIILVLIANLITTAINTVGIYIDSKIYGYYSFAYVFGAVPVRILSGVIRAAIYAAIIWPVWIRLKSVLQRE